MNILACFSGGKEEKFRERSVSDAFVEIKSGSSLYLVEKRIFSGGSFCPCAAR